MIATIDPGDGGAGFVALHLDERARPQQRWVPIVGAHASAVCASRMEAARRCVEALAEQVRPLAVQAQALHKACASVEPTSTATERADRLAHSLALSRGLSLVWGNVSRLFDEPAPHDLVAFDGLRALEPGSMVLDAVRQLDVAHARLTVSQLRAGRTIARLGVRELARACGLSPATVTSIETGGTNTPRDSTLEALRGALQRHRVEFGPDGWTRDIGDARADGVQLGQTAPCARCVQAVDLLAVTRQLIDRVSHTLRGQVAGGRR